MKENFKSGFVAIIGRPNVGKSTLMNHLIGQKIAITSKKPQTTRNRITGVHTVGEDQYVLLDTPGIHRPRTRLGDYMVKVAGDTLGTSDAVILVVEPHGSVGDIEANIEEFRAVIARSEVELQVLGVGADGHLAFNEPGPSLYWSAHKETLDESTIDANARFFASRDEVPRYAVTMGIGEIMMAKRLLMILSGANKEEAARLLLMSDDVTCACPATLMKLHHDATVLITRELADKIGYQG